MERRSATTLFQEPLLSGGGSGSGGGRPSTPRSRIPVGRRDSFLRDVYAHYRSKGLFNIAVTKLLNLLLLLFLAGLAMFVVHFVNYGYLFGENDGPLVYPNPWAKVRPHWLTISVWTLLALVFLVQTVSAFGTVRAHRQVAAFYRTWLGIGQEELEFLRWDEVVERITRVENLSPSHMSALDVIGRITRKENYMIALINKNVLDLRVPLLPRFLGGGSPLVTDTVEWVVWLTLFSINFGPDGIINEHLPQEEWARQLRRRFVLIGIFFLLFSPAICLVLLVYVLLRYGEQIRSDPSSIGGRKWSPLARWRLREINEVHHLFDRRLRRAHAPANDYVAQFPASSIVIVVAKFLSMVLGAAVLMLLAFSFISSRFVFELWGLSSVAWITALTAIVAGLRSVLPPESIAYDFEPSLRAVARHTHYMPTAWIGRAHTKEVFADMSELFQIRVIVWFREVASVFLVPLLCFVSLPNCADAVVAFFKTFTVYRPEVGAVCAFSLLVDPRLGDARYGGSDGGGNSPNMRLADGKLEKSFLSFYASYPFWELPPEGRSILQRLRNFEKRRAEKKEHDRAAILEGSAFAIFANESIVASAGLALSEAKRVQAIESLTETHIDYFLAGEAERREQGQMSPISIDGDDGDAAATSASAVATIEVEPASRPLSASSASVEAARAAETLAGMAPLSLLPPMPLRESFETSGTPHSPDPDLPFVNSPPQRPLS